MFTFPVSFIKTSTPEPTGDQIRAALSGSQLTAYDAAAVNSFVRVTAAQYAQVVTNTSASKYGFSDADVLLRPSVTGWDPAQINGSGIPAGRYIIGFVSEAWNSSGSMRLGYALGQSAGNTITFWDFVTVGPLAQWYYVRKAPTGIEGAPTTTTIFPVIDANTTLNGSNNYNGWSTSDNGANWTVRANSMPKLQVIATATKSW